MAEIPDNLGRVGKFDSADIESIADALKSAVGKAVEYAAGKAKTTSDDMGKRFDELVEAMEELGDDIKDSLDSTRKFVEEVKKAAESIEKKRAAGPAGGDSIAAAQREQTRILNMILKSQQRAISEKAAKFTSGGTVLSSAPQKKRPALKEYGFRPRGADKIPAMLSPGEFVVSKKGAMGNEGVLGRINRGYMSGGKVKPAYLSRGSSPGGSGSGTVTLSPDTPPEMADRIREAFERAGIDAAVAFDNKYRTSLEGKMARWFTGIGAQFTGREDPFAVLFSGSVTDITEYRKEMRKLAFQVEGITGNFREAQAEFSKTGSNIAAETGKNLSAFQKSYTKNLKKGFNEQKAGMSVIKSGLKLSTMIGSETEQTADVFAEWHRSLGLSSVQMEKMATDMRSVAMQTGVTGDELLGAMKSSEGIMKNLRNQGNLTSNVTKSVVTMMAEAKKTGYEESTGKFLTALSSHSGMKSADTPTQALLYSVGNMMGGTATQDMLKGNFMKKRENLAGFSTNMKDLVGGLIGKSGADLDFSKLTEDERDLLAMRLQAYGIEIGEAESLIKTTEKASKGLRGTMDELDAVSKNKFATDEEKRLNEKKKNDALLGASMDFLAGVRDKTGDQSLADAMKQLEGSKDFSNQRADFAAMASAVTPAMARQFGLGGGREQMSQQMAAMDMNKQTQLSAMIAADQLKKAAQAQGKSVKDFGPEMQAALSKGDTKRFNELRDEMQSAASAIGVQDATSVDPTIQLDQTMNKLNETIRKFMSPLVGGILDFIGHMGLLGIQFGLMATALYQTLGGDFIGKIMEGGLGEKLMRFFGKPGELVKDFKHMFGVAKSFGGMSSIDALGFSLSRSISSVIGPTLTKALGPAVLLLGGIKGTMEAEKVGRTKTEGAILGALTGGADTGSFLSPMLGIQKDSVADKTLGVAGAAAWGASAGAAISISLGGLDFGTSIIIGAIIGAGMELVKIVTKGTDILQDIFKPFQVLVDYIYFTFKNIYDVVAGIFTLDFGRVFGAIFNQIGSTIAIIPRLIMGVIQSIFIGLPKLILRALSMLWELPKMMMDSIKNALASMVDNSWVGPIFKVLSDSFNMIYDGFMAIWTPISEIFSGLYTVFNDLGKALFGAGAGGGILSGVMWALQKTIYAVAYVISWMLMPLKLLAWGLGFVLKIVGKTIQGIIWPFQQLYDVLVGHSIVPDLVFGIIKFFAMLPARIFKFLATVPYLIGKALLRVPEAIANAFSNIGSYFTSFGTDSIFGSFMTQIGTLFNFVGGTIKNLVAAASGVLDILYGIFTFDFGMVWSGLKSVGGAIMAQARNFGSFVWNLLGKSMSMFFNMAKKIPKMLLNGMKMVFFDFPSWLMGKLMDGVWAVGNFLVLTLPKIMWQAFKNSLAAVGKFVWDTLSWPFRKIGEWLVWLWGQIQEKAAKAWEFISGLFDVSAWGKWFGGLGVYVYDGFKSALQGVWDWIKSWIPGLGGASKGFSETSAQQEATRQAEGDSISHAIGGLAGAVGDLAQGNLSEAGGKAWSATKEAAGVAWGGIKAVGSYLNPFSYFKEGTKKIEKPGLGMLHAGEMVVPKTMVDKIAAMGSGAFGSISSFMRGKGGGESGGKGLVGSIGEKISGLGNVFKSCCPKEAVEDANDAVGKITDAVAEAMGGVDDSSLFGRLKNQFDKTASYANKFFKPLTTGFTRARKRGEGFIGSMVKGFNSQYMSMTKGGIGGTISGGMDWLGRSIFGEKEGKDTKRGILGRIRDGIFGSKEGEDTKKGILGIVKEGLFGSGDGVKKGLLQIAKEGLFGKEGEGGGILSWARDRIFGQKMKDGEAGPGKPGLLQSAKNTASSLWKATKEKMEINTEEGLFNGAKNAVKKMYGKAKGGLFGYKTAEGEMGPNKPGLIDKAKGKATSLYEKAKGKFFGKDASEAVSEASKADQATKGNLSGIKEKMTNIAEGIKQFSGTQVLFGSLNLIPASAGLTAMIPGSFGAKMLQGIDGEKLKTSLEGLAKGVSSLGTAKVLMGTGAMLLVGIASLGLIPAIPMFALLGTVGPLVEGGLKALGNGLQALGTAAANPLTWAAVGLLAAINVALIPLGYALSLISPVVEAFGTAIKSAFEGAGALLKGVGESIGLILKEITISKALALGVAAVGIGALGVAMAVFAGGGFIASWIDFFSGDGLFNKIMALAAMGPNLYLAASSVDKLGGAFKRFAQNKGGGWKEWLLGSDGVIAGFKKLSEVGTPEFQASADSVHKMAEALEKMQKIRSAPGGTTNNATTATAGAPASDTASDVEPVHLRDITDTILREKAGAGGNRLQSDELSRMEEASYRQVSELEQIRQGIHELVSLMRPRGAGVAGNSQEMDPASTKDPRRPMHAAQFGKMKYGKMGGSPNRSFVNNGEV